MREQSRGMVSGMRSTFTYIETHMPSCDFYGGFGLGGEW